MKLTTALLTTAAAITLALSLSANAQEAQIRQALAEGFPKLEKIDEVRATPLVGLYDVRIGTDLYYTDAKADYVLRGDLIDAKSRRNLTQEHVNKLLAVDFSTLP